MKKMLDLLSAEVAKAFAEAGYDEKYARVSLSNRPDLCEYQCNGAMAAAKEYHKAPIMIANAVVEAMQGSEVFGEVQAVNPGFINMKVNNEYLSQYLNGMEKDERMGCEKAENPKTIMIDYGGPNVAKPLHVGHLRSAIIGESVKRIARFAGHKVIGDVHLGDWQKHRLPSLNWRKYIRQPAENPSRMKRTKRLLCRQLMSCSMEEEAIRLF